MTLLSFTRGSRKREEASPSVRSQKRGDALVLDNASIHTGDENTDLDDWLWNGLSPGDNQPLRITLLLLPARSTEFNPIELLWAQLVKTLR
jgi:transposase